MENIYLSSYKQIEAFDQTLFYKGDTAFEKLILQSDILLSKNLFNEFIEENNIGIPFSIVFKSDEYIIIVSDIVRSYPVFYSLVNNEFFITENIETIPQKNVSNKSASVFLQAGFSLGQNTIYQNVFGIQAAERITINRKNKKVKSQRYFEFLPSSEAEDKSIEDFVTEFDALMLCIIKKLVDTTPSDKNLIVPLSGGHDSRIIVNYLKKLNAKNIICFSYGQKNNTQANLSERVAKACGYKWFFVEYTEEKWARLHDMGLIDKYSGFSFQGVSIPHLQDFLAVYELKEKKIIKKGDVFIPGHALDMLVGAHFNHLDLNCNDKLSSIKRTSSRHSVVPIDFLKPSYLDSLDSIYKEVNTEPYLFQEYINWQERQSKFIVNSCRVYDFFGFEFRLPFWDIKLVKYILTLNQNNRIGRNLFLISDRNGILLPELSEIEFEDEVNTKSVKASIREKALNRIPPLARSWISRFLGKKTYKAESLNQIYALQGYTVKDILGSWESYPKEMHNYFKTILIRKPYQISNNTLTSLLAINKAFDKKMQK
jgi:asparagine synthase (glutamine-hydrolysing)